MDLTLSKRRKEAGLTQSDLAQSLGVSQSQVSNYETSGEIPTRLLEPWADAIGCTTKDIQFSPPSDESVMNLTLLERRKEAGLTQSDLAQSLGITQGQVSNYEISGEIPLSLLRAWASTIGCTIDDLIPSGQSVNGKDIFKFDKNIYEPLIKDLSGVLKYINRFEDLLEFSDVEQFQDIVIALRDKPWVVITGPFDAGKSHLCNFYLGGNMLPTGYRPVTKFPTFVRHISDRPEWFQEDVWLMGQKFDPKKWHDEKHCTENRILAGSWDTLKQHASLKSRKDNREEGYVLAFVDAPLLHACVLVDLPGYDDAMTNADIINPLIRRADILLYLCSATGFLTDKDLERLKSFFSFLPDYKEYHENFPAFSNFFIIASQAFQGITKIKLKTEILEDGSKTFHDYLLETSPDQSRSRKPQILLEDIRARFFSFYQESPERREDLEHNLKSLLKKYMPSVWKNLVSETICRFKEEEIKIYADKQKKYEKILEEVESHDEKLENGKSDTKDTNRVIDTIQETITEYREKDLKKVQEIFECKTKVSNMTCMIKTRYNENEKEKAQQQAATYVLGEIFFETAQYRKKLVKDADEAIAEYIENFINDYNVSRKDLDGSVGKVSLLNRSRSTLHGLLASFAGANIITSGIIALLGASLGIVAVPITLGGVATIAAIVDEVIYHTNWQQHLAKRINSVFEKKDIRSKFENNVEFFWQEKLNELNKALPAIKKEWKYAEEIKNFFQAIPWREEEVISDQRTTRKTVDQS